MAGLERWVAVLEYGDGLKQLIALVSLCSLRFLVVMLVMPATDGQRLTGGLRAVLPICVGVYIAWGQDPALLKDVDTLALAVLFLKEALIGLLIGFAAATIFWVAEGVGTLIDNLAGYNNVQQSNPQSSDQSTPIGHLLQEMAVFAFWILGGMTALIGVVMKSCEWWPLTATLPAWPIPLEQFVTSQVTAYIIAVTRIATPVLVTLVLIDLGIGLLTKAAEKLEPNSMAQPIKGAVALLLVSLLIGVFFEQFKGSLALLNFEREFRTLTGR